MFERFERPIIVALLLAIDSRNIEPTKWERDYEIKNETLSRTPTSVVEDS